jgi:hypothetical protein
MKSRLMVVVLVMMSGCTRQSPQMADAGVEPRGLPEVSHAREHLRWKRFRAVQQDLSRALSVPLDALCSEPGGSACVQAGPVSLKDWLRIQERLQGQALEDRCAQLQRRATCEDGAYVPFDEPRGVHVLSLGGSSPFLAGVYDPLAAPNVQTPLALERLALMACGEATKNPASRALFEGLDLTAATPVTPQTMGVQTTASQLGQALLGRSLETAELDALVGLTQRTPMTAAAFARLACFTLATHEEFLFQ